MKRGRNVLGVIATVLVGVNVWRLFNSTTTVIVVTASRIKLDNLILLRAIRGQCLVPGESFQTGWFLLSSLARHLVVVVKLCLKMQVVFLSRARRTFKLSPDSYRNS